MEFQKEWLLTYILKLKMHCLRKIPQPDQYGFNRNADGSIIEPKQLVVIKEGSNSLIPVLGIVIDF
jgi:hypothetical protein